MKNEQKALDAKARRIAAANGFFIRKSRARNLTPTDHGEYSIWDGGMNIPVFGSYFEASIEECIEWLTHEEEPEAPAANWIEHRNATDAKCRASKLALVANNTDRVGAIWKGVFKPE